MKKVLKKGPFRFYFPDFPDHPFNGAFAHATGRYTEERNGRKVRRRIETIEDSKHNRSVSSGFWKGAIEIKSEDFGESPVMVKLWSAEFEAEYFYLECL